MKLVVEERESAALHELLLAEADQVASAIVEIEVVRAVRRAAPDLTALALAERVVAQVTTIEPTAAIRARAALLEPMTLRSLDALHLATALEVGDALDGLVTYDARLAAGAVRHDLLVLSPA